MKKNQIEASKKSHEPVIPLNWTSNVGVSLGGAGASLLVLLTTLQISSGVEPESKQLYEAPVFWSLLALVLWVGLWKLGDTHEFWLHKYPQKMKKFPFENWLLLPFFTALSTLIVAVGSLVQTYAIWPLVFASIVFLSYLLVLAWHNRKLKHFVSTQPTPVRRLRKRK